MRSPVFVGLIELDPQPWVDIGALVVAQQLALPGHRVVVIDADPCSAMLTSWARGAAASGAALWPLIGGWAPDELRSCSRAVAELLQDEESGPIGVMCATEDAPERRPPAPSARSIRGARERLGRLRLDGEPVEIVLVRLPPLSVPLGVALAANLCDALVPILPPTPAALGRGMRALNEVGALRGEPLRLYPVELCADEPWAPAEALWLAALRVLPVGRVRPWPSAEPRLAGVPRATSAQRDDLRDLADTLLLQLDLAHPDAVEHVMRADALGDGQGAYDGFARMLAQDPPEALRFFGEVLAKRASTRKSAVEALRAMVDSPRIDAEDLAWAFKYAIQKFRPEEPDPLAAFMHQLGERLLEAQRHGLIEEGQTRLQIDVADALLKHADYLQSIGQPTDGLELRAEHMLLAVAPKVTEPQEALRLAVVLSHHAERARHSRNAALAMMLLRRGLGAKREPVVLLNKACDVLGPFLVAGDDPAVLAQHREYATALLPLDPGAAHYNLIYSFTYAGDKEQAYRHFALLAEADPDRFRLAALDPTLRAFFDGIGTPDFFNAVPKKDKH